MQKKFVAGLLILAGVASVASANPRVRVFHLSPDTPAVQVRVNDGLPPAIPSLSYRSITNYVPLPSAGNYNFKVAAVVAPDANAIDVTVPLAANTDYSVAAIGLLGGSPNLAPLLLQDDNTVNPSAARVRFVHASANAPAVDVFAVGLAQPLFANVTFGNSGGYINVPGGTYDLEVRIAGGGATVLSLPGVAFSNGTVATAWAVGLVGSSTTPLGAELTVDVIPAPGAAGLLALGGIVACRRRRAKAA
jgi:hypothetical protein